MSEFFHRGVGQDKFVCGGPQSSYDDAHVYVSIWDVDFLCESGEGISMPVMCSWHVLELDVLKGFYQLLNGSSIGTRSISLSAKSPLMCLIRTSLYLKFLNSLFQGESKPYNKSFILSFIIGSKEI